MKVCKMNLWKSDSGTDGSGAQHASCLLNTQQWNPASTETVFCADKKSGGQT